MNPLKDIRDIENIKDIELLVNTFYSQIVLDDEIGFIFNQHMEGSLEAHLPKMYAFWASLLFQKATYQGNPMRVHQALNQRIQLTPQHFERWILLWNQTVDQLFVGVKAEEAKNKANMIQMTLRSKILKDK